MTDDIRINHIAGGTANTWLTIRRHPCEVTADRLLADLERHPDAFDGEARDAVAKVRFILHEIADGNR